jgi:C-8 sterol isomerase
MSRFIELTDACVFFAGWIPLMLPFGYADALSSTLDYVTLYRTTVWTAREIIKNLLVGKI